MTIKAWASAVVLFFAWGFVMHTTGLLLHEFGGHATAAAVLGCGTSGYKLTFFGHGQVHFTTPCPRWTWSTIVIADWAGLVLTIAAGIAAGLVLHRRRDLAPMTRLLLALVAFFFLLGQLGYATAGGFHDLYDPGRTARRLGALGVHVLAWLPPMIGYGVSAFLFARAAVVAFREHFGSRSRLHTVKQLVATLGVAGLLYFLAFRIEWPLRTDLTMRGVAGEAERVAVAKHAAPPFPIELVLLALALAGVVTALVRPVRDGVSARESRVPLPIPRGVVRAVAALAGASLAALVVLILV